MATQELKTLPTDTIPIEEAASIIGVSLRRIRKICESGRLGYKLRVTSHVEVWVITRSEAEKFAKQDRPSGRPRKIA